MLKFLDWFRKQGKVNKSETRLCRRRLGKYCLGNGVDLGFGGDPIVETAVTVDLCRPYARYSERKANLAGDARDLYWFKDNVLDYVYSSHLLEDFTNTEEVLREWIRVLKPGGNLVLYCPDERLYRKHCSAQGKQPNVHHKIADFSLEYVQKVLDNIGQTETVYSNPHVEDYSFEIVAVKIKTGKMRNG